MLKCLLYVWTLCLWKQLPRNLFEIQGHLVGWSERSGSILVFQNYPITRGDVNMKIILSRSKTILSGANGDVIMSKGIGEHSGWSWSGIQLKRTWNAKIKISKFGIISPYSQRGTELLPSC
jgi:hypothetical protein